MWSSWRGHGPEAIAALANIMQDPETPPAARVAAATAILDRAYKPPQALARIDPVGSHDFDHMSEQELRVYIRAASNRCGLEIGDRGRRAERRRARWRSSKASWRRLRRGSPPPDQRSALRIRTLRQIVVRSRCGRGAEPHVALTFGPDIEQRKSKIEALVTTLPDSIKRLRVRAS